MSKSCKLFQTDRAGAKNHQAMNSSHLLSHEQCRVTRVAESVPSIQRCELPPSQVLGSEPSYLGLIISLFYHFAHPTSTKCRIDSVRIRVLPQPGRLILPKARRVYPKRNPERSQSLNCPAKGELLTALVANAPIGSESLRGLLR